MKTIEEIYKLKELPSILYVKKGIKKVISFKHVGGLKPRCIEIIAKESGGEIELKGSVYLKNSQNFDLKTITTHYVGKNRIRVHIKAVLGDMSKLKYEGLINIEKGADFSDSYLQQDNLILSDNAVCNSTPQLQIKANEVKASHGVTVGSFDPTQLFYLKSRGLSEKAAKKLLIEGFLTQ